MPKFRFYIFTFHRKLLSQMSTPTDVKCVYEICHNLSFGNWFVLMELGSGGHIGFCTFQLVLQHIHDHMMMVNDTKCDEDKSVSSNTSTNQSHARFSDDGNVGSCINVSIEEDGSTSTCSTTSKKQAKMCYSL